MSRTVAFAVLGEPCERYTIHEPKLIEASNDSVLVEIPQVYPDDDPNARAVVYEWACNGAAPGTACTGMESYGVFRLIMVCASHGENPGS